MKAGFDATGDVVVVTGGARGIGAALARAVGSLGGTAVVLDVAPSPDLDDAPGVVQLTVDVSDRAAVSDVVAAAVDAHGPVTGLVAGAAIQPRTPASEVSADEWHRVLGVNLDGVVWSCQAVLPSMLAQRRGSIVLFTSGLATVGHAGAAAYAASKGAMIPFAKSLAAEVAESRVRVNVLAPGVIDTPQFQAANPEGPERAHWERTTGIGRPADVVGPLLFLLSDAASLTGSTLTRDRAFSADAR
ncbi:SDR family NAD(P)-dependent oxidoreductase [Microbacterium sp. 18062]|uniref:SDR family NAD(P)-dependent oxidoreductase n=1 Tax=Microbacterium sp. 18062 TaxID=2681410 RepID=UPI001359CDAB|nr:SDR family oxidoreductase [Microbacterium sp. 18062]